MAIPMSANLYGSGVAPSATRTGDGKGNIIPAFWSFLANVVFYASTTIGSIVNRKWEGEIKSKGDTVYIFTRPNFNIDIAGPSSTPAYGTDRASYVPGIGIKRRFDRAIMSGQKLSIDYEAQWGIQDDDVIKYQADLDYIRQFIDGAGADMAVAVDKSILQALPAKADAKNKGANAGVLTKKFNLGTTSAPVDITPRNVLDFISDCGTVLSEQHAPVEDRFVIVPPAFTGALQKSDLRNASFSNMGSSLMKNGYYGRIAGFDIYESTSMTQGTQGGKSYYSSIFGQRNAVTFAGQFDRMEGPMRDIEHDGDFYKGKALYGFEAIKKEALGQVVMTVSG